MKVRVYAIYQIINSQTMVRTEIRYRIGNRLLIAPVKGPVRVVSRLEFLKLQENQVSVLDNATQFVITPIT